MKNTPTIINTRDMSAEDRPLMPVVDANRPAAGNGRTTYKTATAAANAAKTAAEEAAQAAEDARSSMFCLFKKQNEHEKLNELLEEHWLIISKTLGQILIFSHVVLALSIVLSVCNLLILIF